MQVRRLTASLGAEIAGTQVSALLEPSKLAALVAVWERYGVLVFRNQSIGDAGQIQFARALGTLAAFGSGDGEPRTEIDVASNLDADGRLLPIDDMRSKLLTINRFWHIDGCYRSHPNKGTVLRAIAMPEHGGETVFADLAAAYATLPEPIRHRLDALYCLHSFAHMLQRCGMEAFAPGEIATLPAWRHPLVRRHADGRRSLFLSPPYMESIESLDYHQSQILVGQLVTWATQRQFLYVHRWRRGDLVLWDNRWTMHMVTPYDIARAPRVMHGAVLLGDEAVNGVGHSSA